MDCTKIVIGKNITKQRMRRNMTQKQLADRISELSGRQVSASTVSKWENGVYEIGISTIAHICHALECSSYVLYPRSNFYTEDDVQLLDSIMALPPRIKKIIDFLINKWDGDDIAFWEFGLLYFVLSKYRRKFIAKAGVEEYMDAERNEPEAIEKIEGLDVNIKLLRRAIRELEKEDPFDQ